MTPMVFKLFSMAEVCATVSIPDANPETIQISVLFKPEIIFLKLSLELELAFLEPTTAKVLSKLQSNNLPL